MGWDMKNKFLKKIFVLLAVLSSCFLFASFSPSLDGRAVVVNEGEMPSGLFAKTVGYLPGDTIIVSNVDGTASVEILVIGSLDASEGVAIMLSPEAASAIGIDKNENNIVKITKRSDKDERCTGTAVIAKGSEIEEKNDIQDNVIEENIDEVETENQSELSELENTDESEEILQAEEETFVEEEVLPETEENKSEVVEEEILQSEEETFAEEEVLPETEENITEEVESEEALVDELSELENTDEREEILQAEEENFVEEEVLPETEENVTEELESEEALVDELSELENSDESEEILQAEEENFVEEETFVEEEVLSETEENITEELESEEKSDSDEYEAIVLIPVEPEKAIILSDEKENNEEEIILEKLETRTENSEITISESEKNVETKSVIEKYKVESLDKLEKGSYYIQIVVLKEESNIQKIIDEYGNNYPITIVPLKSKTAYQILIGPISMDEYGTVLNRFKSYGYKDAFLRKIK